nr:immunoglobulin heavy chain junction region [Mus musculus]
CARPAPYGSSYAWFAYW